MRVLTFFLLLFGVAAGSLATPGTTILELQKGTSELHSLQTPRRSGGVVTIVPAPVQVAQASMAATVEESQQAEAFYVVKPGDTGLKRFGARAWPQIVRLNGLNNPNLIIPGQKLRLPENVRGRDDMMVMIRGRGESVIALKRPAKEVSCITLGVAPWNTERDNAQRRARALEGISLLTELTPEKRELAKVKFLMGQAASTKELVGRQIFTEMLYQGKVSGQAKHVYGKPICSPDEGGQPEVMDTYDLGEGVFLAIPRRCGNPAVLLKPVPRREEPPVVAAPPPPQLAVDPPAPPPPVAVRMPPPPAVEEACEEWNVRASAGLELSQGTGARTVAHYADAEVGACPFTWEGEDGTFNEALIAGRLYGTTDHWHGWNGDARTALIGLGLRRSHSDGSGDLFRLMVGARTSEGSQGLYHQDVSWKVVGLFGTHYRIDDDGQNETHYRLGLTVPLGDATGSASWNGTPLPLPQYNGSVEAGVRYYLDPKDESGEWRKFLEANGSIVSPDYAGIGLRVGVCNGNDTLCFLAGVNFDLQNGGEAAMVGAQVNTPGVIRVERGQIIDQKMQKAAEVNGITFTFAPAIRKAK